MLEELVAHPGWRVLEDYGRRVLAAPLQRQLLSGAHKTLEDMQRAAGTLNGIDRVLGAPAAVREMVNTELSERVGVGESVV